MPPQIRRLAETTVNRIAAGEVIERPAAAVKELVENALDAGAKRIEVILAGGGIERIEIIDDGCGIAAEQLALAIERHATSKLADEALVRITTLGFRGEALPSIGAAAKLTLISRPAEQDSAYRINVSGGAVSEVAPAPGVTGTRAIVEDLFYATPARRKFLRSPRAEAAERTVWRLALAAPHVAFRLVSGERVLFDLPAQTEAARVSALFGRETAASLLPLEAEREDVQLTGLIGPASLSRATMGLQSFVVNGRPVQDPMLRLSLRLAYRDVMQAGRHAVAALRLTLPEEALDVNVHPAKTELRFADANGIRSLVIGAITRTLERPVSLALAPAAAPAPSRAPAPRLPFGAPPPPSYAARGFAEAELALAAPPAARQFSAPPAPPPTEHPLGAPLAQILDTYILAAAADGSLVIVDQHAAHERLTEERLREEFTAGRVASQPLLVPVVVDFPPIEAARLMAEAGTLERLGLEIEAFGPGAILVRAVPAALKNPDAAGLLRDLAGEFAESDAPLALEAKLDGALARLACHRSIRAGRRLALEEMSALLREMEATPRAATCSHGRPTFLKLSRADLEVMFGRRN
ncbi:DNA mismatch repair endonuclease MutL [Acidocella aromatica]|uniref:DNA mismatch repair protein MutL n=1 Tax=Acidocella aromatica TaxID=1303579 RepID=A0A840VB71_9PROT|nr:DNA mismatch repair endonuclease MutL [Acidocella aromatica]MBB5373158.1 DNA mismatch repair protein MutL [Acidocella aromatica]